MSLKLPIYLDNNATTRCDPRVVEAMLPYFTEHLRQRRQPQSRLRLGGGGTARRERPRSGARVELIGAGNAKEIIFTSGATESNNLALKGVAADVPARRATTSSPPSPSTRPSSTRASGWSAMASR